MDFLVIQLVVSTFLDLFVLVFEVKLGVIAFFVLIIRVKMILLNAEIHLMIIGLIYTWIKFDYVFPLDLVHLRFQMVLDNRSVFKNLRIELLPLFLGLLSDFSNLVLLFFAQGLWILIEAHSQKLAVIVFEAYGDLHAVIEAVKYYFTVVFANN